MKVRRSSHSSAGTPLRLAGYAFALAIALAAAVAVFALREREVQAWRSQTDVMSLMLSEQTAQTFISAYLLLDNMVDEVRRTGALDPAAFRDRMSRQDIHDMLRAMIRGLPQVDVATVVADNGDNINFSRSFPVRGINLADRDYFRAHVGNPRLGDFISAPVQNRGNGKWTVYISRRLDDDHGNFLGLVLVGLSVGGLETYFDQIVKSLGEGAVINLYRSDLTLLARAPHSDSALGTVNNVGATHELIVGRNERSGVIVTNGNAFVKGIPMLRIGAIRSLEQFPLVVSLIVPEEIFLANWRRASAAILGVALAGAIGIVLAMRALALHVERREGAERELKASESRVGRERARLHTVLETAADGIHILDEGGTLVEANESFLRMLGYEPSHVGNARVTDFEAERSWEEIKARNDALVARRGKITFETKYRCSDGRVLDVEVSASGSEIDGAKYVYAAARDVTPRKQRERQLEDAKATAVAATLAKSQFLATMSHEIRTPMNAILGMAQLLQLPGASESNRANYAKVILECGESLLVILNDILDLSRIEAGRVKLEPSVFEPKRLIDDVAAVFSRNAVAKELTLEVAWHGAPGAAYVADQVRVRQMLSNLVSNAIKFTDRGFVRIEGADRPDGRGGAMLEFSVRDTGVGIDPAEQATLFKPFTQVGDTAARAHGGTGLGLSIVRELAHLMGGDVGLTSAVGEGSRFWFTVSAGSATTPGGAEAGTGKDATEPELRGGDPQ